MEIEDTVAAIAAHFSGRPWLFATEVTQAATGALKQLRGWGAERCFVIAAREGTGDPPDPADAELRVLGMAPMEMMEAIHASEAALRDLPEAVQAAVDRFDPERRMQVLGAIFSDGRPVAGRRFFGARRAAWQALEDKTVVDAVWDAVGVRRAPVEVVAVERAALRDSAARVDRGDGTVWAGDASRGFHGGATYTCFVRDETQAAWATERLAGRCQTARVMPFLAGIPCSMHGVVFPSHVVVLRPAEMVTLRQADGTGFRYGRAATFWDPPAPERAAMRTMVRAVGEHLRASVGYRGAFTIDGVMTRDGFLPTELNPRVGAALGMMVPRFPWDRLCEVLIEGLPLAVDPVALEAELLAAADAQRCGSLGFVDPLPLTETRRFDLSWIDEAWHEAAPGAPVDAVASVGPGPSGAFLRLALDPIRTPVGASVAPRAVALAAWADAHLGTTIGTVWAARAADDPANDAQR